MKADVYPAPDEESSHEHEDQDHEDEGQEGEPRSPRAAGAVGALQGGDGETTKSPNKKFLVRRIEEALAARAVELALAEEPQRPTRTSARAKSAPEPETTLAESTPPKPRERFAAMTIEELQAKYLEVVGRSTGSATTAATSSGRSARRREGPHQCRAAQDARARR